MPTKPEPDRSARADAEAGAPVLELRGLEVHFQLQGGALSRILGLRARSVKAVDGVNLTLHRGEVLGLVGESGSGKTTLGRALLGLVQPTGGSITYHDRVRGEREVARMRGAELRDLRTDLQMIFQDPHAALNPSMTVETAVGHPLVIHKIAKGDELRRLVSVALERVGLSPVERFLDKLPADLSGGQKQRAVIARAIVLEPEVVVADEPVSMLDMSVRAKILELMVELKEELGLSYVYITHDLASAKYLCDRIAIMYLGRVVEVGPTREIFENPRHPYTKALLAAIPEPDPERQLPRHLPRGEIPDAAAPPLGCAFHPRCPEAVAECGWESRDLRNVIEEHWTRGDEGAFETERRVIGDLDHLDAPSTRAKLGSGDGADVRDLLEQIRTADPDEPFWTGVDDIAADGSGVALTLHEGVDPALRAAGGVEVACVLYPESDR